MHVGKRAAPTGLEGEGLVVLRNGKEVEQLNLVKVRGLGDEISVSLKGYL